MVVTVTCKDYNLINACEDETQWTGATTYDQTTFYKEGTQCVGFQLWQSGNLDVYITVTEDLSGTTHVRAWMMTTVLNELNTDANGGIQLYLSDGTNTGYWYVSGSTSYPGGWYNLVIDVSRAVDSGTKPTAMNAITTLGFRFNLTASAKKVESLWIDHIYSGSGLIAYGDVGGVEFDLDDILVEDEDTTNGWGILRKIGGVFYTNGSLTIGDGTSTNACDFQTTNDILIFEERAVGSSINVSSTLYTIECLGNGTGATSILFGDKSGTAGISGCTIKANDINRPVYLTATDTDVATFGLYGSVFDTYGTIDLQPDGTSLEVLNCSFNNGIGQFQPNTMDVTNCNFVSGPSAGNGTVLMESASHNITYCSFISNPDAIEISVAAAISFNNLTFTNNTYDVYNSSGSAVTVSQTNSDASSYNAAGSVVSFETTVDIDIHVEDTGGGDIVGAQVYMQKNSPTTYNSHATNNSQGDFTFEASASVGSDTAASGWIIVRAVDEKEWHWYRYASRTATVFTFPTASTGTQTGSTDPVILNDSAANFGGTESVIEGDFIRNTSDGSWAQIKSVESTTQLITSKLVGGTLDTWTASDNYSIHSLEMTYDGSDTFTVPLVNTGTDGTGDVSFSYVHPGGTVVATIKARHSPDTGTKYLPTNASASFTGAYSTTMIMFEDTTAS